MTRFKPRREPATDARPGRKTGGDVWLYGLHAVAAGARQPGAPAEAPARHRRGRGSPRPRLRRNPARHRRATATRRDIDAVLPPGAVHQGVAMLCPPLPAADIADIPEAPADGAPPPARRVVVALDQVADPHNVGAVLRTAAAFGALAVLLPDRHAPEETGAIAKAACGALETVPLVRAVNFARALDALKEKGFWCVGLDGGADATLAEQDLPDALVLVLGAEGAGLRRLSLEACDFTARLPDPPRHGEPQRLQRRGDRALRPARLKTPLERRKDRSDPGAADYRGPFDGTAPNPSPNGGDIRSPRLFWRRA